MKIKSLHIIAYLILSSVYAFSQNKPVEDVISYNQLYLTYQQNNIKFANLKPSNLVKFLGKPIKIKKEKWETNNANVTKTYIYINGDVVFEDNVLSFIDIKRSGWAFTFKFNNKLTQTFTVGSKIHLLKKIFPNSWANHKGNIVRVQIGTSDEAIVFTISGLFIKSVSLFSNES
jgi:hypothetical protein